MDISTALSKDLANMLLVLDLPDLDVEATLLALRTDVQSAVPSFVGLSMTLVMHGQPVTLTSMNLSDPLPDIASTLRLPVALAATVAPDSRLTLFATAPGAFVDLAADVRYALSALDDEVSIDQDLQPSTLVSGVSGLAELSMVNRALGLLMGRGLTLAAAQEHLQRQADQSNLQLFQVAAFMVSMTE